jgi:hypothetical protein
VPCEDPVELTRRIAAVKTGSELAVQPLREYDFSRMVELPRPRLRSMRCRNDGDDEDTILDAFDCLCTGMAQGRCPSWLAKRPAGQEHLFGHAGTARPQPTRHRLDPSDRCGLPPFPGRLA